MVYMPNQIFQPSYKCLQLYLKLTKNDQPILDTESLLPNNKSLQYIYFYADHVSEAFLQHINENRQICTKKNI